MNNQLSLSVFTIEIDCKPVVAFRSRKYSEAEAICTDERVRKKLSSMSSGGKPLCDDLSILSVRMARPAERAKYYEQAASQLNQTRLTMVYLVDLDDQP